MYDALAVRGREAPRDLLAPLDRVALRDRGGIELAPQRLALEELGDEKRSGLGRPHVVEREQVGMIQRADRPHFLLEAPQSIRIRRDLARQDFDRDVAADARIAGPVDLAHAARTEGVDDFVGAEFGACVQRHVNESRIISLQA